MGARRRAIASGSDEEQMDQPVRRKRRNTIASSSVSGDEADLPPPLGTERTLRKRSKWSGNVLSAMAGMRRRQGSPVKGSTVPASAACTGVCVADSALEGPTRQRDSCDDLGTTDKISATHASSEKLQFGTNTTARSNSPPPVTEKLAPAENDEEFKVISPAVGGHPELVPPSIVQLPARTDDVGHTSTAAKALDVTFSGTLDRTPEPAALANDDPHNDRDTESDSPLFLRPHVRRVRRRTARLDPEQSKVLHAAKHFLRTRKLGDNVKIARLQAISELSVQEIWQFVSDNLKRAQGKWVWDVLDHKALVAGGSSPVCPQSVEHADSKPSSTDHTECPRVTMSPPADLPAQSVQDMHTFRDARCNVESLSSDQTDRSSGAVGSRARHRFSGGLRISCTVAPTKVPTSVEALDVPAVATSEQLPQLGDLTDDLLDANGRQSENDSVPSAQVLVPKVRREVPRLNPEQSNVTDTATQHLQTQMLDDRAQSQRHVTSEPPAEGILQSVVSSNFTVERTASPVESDTDRVDLEMRPAEKSDRPSGAVGSQLRSRFSSGPRMGKSKKWVPMEVPLAGEENLAPLGNKKCGHVRRMKPSEANSHWVCQDCGEMLIFDGWRREMGGASDMRL